MSKKIAVLCLVALIFVFMAASLNGCVGSTSTGSTGNFTSEQVSAFLGNLTTLTGFAFLAKYATNDINAGWQGQFVRFFMHNSLYGRIPMTGNVHVTGPNGWGSATLARGGGAAVNIGTFYYGPIPTVVPGPIDYVYETPSAYSAPDQFIWPGWENGRYLYNIIGTQRTILDNTPYPGFLTITTPLIAPAPPPPWALPINVAWTSIGTDYVYNIVAYTTDPGGNHPKLWSSDDIRGYDWRNPQTLKDIFALFSGYGTPAGTPMNINIPNGIFVGGETVAIRVIAIDRTNFAFATEAPYGTVQINWSWCNVEVTL
ncbi:MAG: hypothetical protein V2A78_00600 [bacterium]